MHEVKKKHGRIWTNSLSCVKCHGNASLNPLNAGKWKTCFVALSMHCQVQRFQTTKLGFDFDGLSIGARARGSDKSKIFSTVERYELRVWVDLFLQYFKPTSTSIRQLCRSADVKNGTYFKFPRTRRPQIEKHRPTDVWSFSIIINQDLDHRKQSQMAKRRHHRRRRRRGLNNCASVRSNLGFAASPTSPNVCDGLCVTEFYNGSPENNCLHFLLPNTRWCYFGMRFHRRAHRVYVQ